MDELLSLELLKILYHRNLPPCPSPWYRTGRGKECAHSFMCSEEPSTRPCSFYYCRRQVHVSGVKPLDSLLEGNGNNLQDSLTLGQFFRPDSQFQEGFLISIPWQGHIEDVNRQLDKIGSN